MLIRGVETPVYVVSLPKRSEKWVYTREHLWYNDIEDPILFEATEHEQGWKGLNETMGRLFNLVSGPVCAFEDDVKFVGPLSKFLQAAKELPKDYDCLYLGANIQEDCPKYSENLNVLTFGWTTHAVLYSKKFVDYCKKEFKGIEQDCPIDDWLRVYIQPKGKCFVTNPLVCVQRPGCSDTLGGEFVDHTDFFLKSHLYLK